MNQLINPSDQSIEIVFDNKINSENLNRILNLFESGESQSDEEWKELTRKLETKTAGLPELKLHIENYLRKLEIELQKSKKSFQCIYNLDLSVCCNSSFISCVKFLTIHTNIMLEQRNQLTSVLQYLKNL